MFFSKSSLIVLIALALSACGKNAIVDNITVKSSVDSNQDFLVEMDAQLNMGGLSFPALTIPVPNPKFPSENLGIITLKRTIDGKNQLGLQANISEITHNQLPQDNLLPNGQEIPVAGLNGVVSISVNSRSKVYVGGNDTSIMVGLALAIPLFDNIGKYLPGVNLFLPLPTNSKIEGLAGVFTGATSQSGLGLFFKVPNTLSSNSLATKSLSSNSIMSKSLCLDCAAKQNQSNTSMRFISSDDKTQKSQSVQRMLINMSLQNRILSIK